MRNKNNRNKLADEIIAALLDIIIKNKISLDDSLKLKLRTWVVMYEGKESKEADIYVEWGCKNKRT